MPRRLNGDLCVRAAELKKQGLSFSAVGLRMGKSKSTAQRWVREGRKRISARELIARLLGGRRAT